MAKIEWKDGADSILRKIRALGDRPGVWCNFRDERLALHGLEESLLPNSLKKPGELQIVEGNLLVRCGDSVLTVTELTPAGKKRMSGGDFARGARLTAGERFE
jgi:methionyl-tRNA formyltransferase